MPRQRRDVPPKDMLKYELQKFIRRSGAYGEKEAELRWNALVLLAHQHDLMVPAKKPDYQTPTMGTLEKSFPEASVCFKKVPVTRTRYDFEVFTLSNNFLGTIKHLGFRDAYHWFPGEVVTTGAKELKDVAHLLERATAMLEVQQKIEEISVNS